MTCHCREPELFGPCGCSGWTYPLDAGVLSEALWVQVDEQYVTGQWVLRADNNGAGASYIAECDEVDNELHWP